MPKAPWHSPPHRIFSVVPISAGPRDDLVCLSDDAASVAGFMWGRIITKYQLYVNGREYGWGGVSELEEIAIHLRYCLEMDEVLYEHD